MTRWGSSPQKLLAGSAFWLLIIGAIMSCLFDAASPPAHAARQEALPTVTSTPLSGPAGTQVDISGSGWLHVADGQSITFLYTMASHCRNAAGPTSNLQKGTMHNGSFSGWLRIPPGTSTGTYTLCALINSQPVTSANHYTLLSSAPANLSVSPHVLVNGQQVTITGQNFLPAGTDVTLLLKNTSGSTILNLGRLTSDAKGSFHRTFTVLHQSPGNLTLSASVGSLLSAFVAITLEPQPASIPTPIFRPTPQPKATPTIQATPVSTPSASQTLTPRENTENAPPLSRPATNQPQAPLSLVGIGTLAALLLLTTLMASWALHRHKQAASRKAQPTHLPWQASPMLQAERLRREEASHPGESCAWNTATLEMPLTPRPTPHPFEDLLHQSHTDPALFPEPSQAKHLTREP